MPAALPPKVEVESRATIAADKARHTSVDIVPKDPLDRPHGADASFKGSGGALQVRANRSAPYRGVHLRDGRIPSAPQPLISPRISPHPLTDPRKAKTRGGVTH